MHDDVYAVETYSMYAIPYPKTSVAGVLGMAVPQRGRSSDIPTNTAAYHTGRNTCGVSDCEP